MRIPHDQLNPDTLQSLIEEYASRDGTDYGAEEVSLSTRVMQLRRQLERGEVIIWFDPESETCTLLNRRDCDNLDEQ